MTSSKVHQGYCVLAAGLVLLLIAALWFAMEGQAAAASRGGDRVRQQPAPHRVQGPSGGPTPRVQAPARKPAPLAPAHVFRDVRYRHDRSYPARGVRVVQLPREHRVVVQGGSRFYFSGGAWYRPEGNGFVVVTPPLGFHLPFLPPFVTRVWVRNVPYYYANDIYYTRHGSGYVVVAPPAEEVIPDPPLPDKLFIYPGLDQSEEEQAADRYECHRWAVSQTDFDPTMHGSAAAGDAKRNGEYQRAFTACLDGRGYTVK